MMWIDAWIVPVEAVEPEPGRASLIKELWAIADFPPAMLEGEDGMLLDIPTFDLRYEIITYGAHRVVEAEGVVVCRLS